MFDWTKLGIFKVKPKNPNHEFYHGFVVETGKYHALVIDSILRRASGKQTPLKAILLGQVTDCLIDKITTEDPEMAEVFFKKYNNL